MSGLFAMAVGVLIADPVPRQSAKGISFATATIRAQTDEEAILVSVAGLGAEGEQLLGFAKGDAITASGKARLTSWVGRDGSPKTGLSVTISAIAALKPRPKRANDDSTPRRRRSAYSAYRPQSPTDDRPALDDEIPF